MMYVPGSPQSNRKDQEEIERLLEGETVGLRGFASGDSLLRSSTKTPGTAAIGANVNRVIPQRSLPNR
jgi:hypothetical protein